MLILLFRFRGSGYSLIVEHKILMRQALLFQYFGCHNLVKGDFLYIIIIERLNNSDMRCVFMILFFSTLGFAQLNNHSNYFLIEESELQHLSVEQKQELEVVLDDFHSAADDEEKLELLVNYIENTLLEERRKEGLLYGKWVIDHIDNERKKLKNAGVNISNLRRLKRISLKVLIRYYFFYGLERENFDATLLGFLDVSQSLNDQLEIIVILGALGGYYEVNFESKKAKNYYKTCIDVFESSGDLSFRGVANEVVETYSGLTRIALNEHKLNLGSHYIQKGLDIFESCTSDIVKVSFLLVQGNLFLIKKEFSSAIKCFYKVADMNIDEEFIYISYVCLTELFVELNDLESAVKYIDKIKHCRIRFQEIHQPVILSLEAKLLFKKGSYRESIEMHKKLLEIQAPEKLKIEPYYYLGRSYEQIENYELALFFYDKALSLSKRENDVFNFINSSCALGRLLWETGNKEKAKSTLESIFQLAKSVEDPWLLMEVTKQLYEIYKEEKNDKKALTLLELYKSCVDSVSGFEEIRIALKEKNNYEEKLIELRNQSKIKEKEKNIYMWIIIAIGVFILFVISHYISFRRKQKNRMLENKIQIVELTLSDFVFRKKIEFIESKKEAENKIKNKVSKDLHDSVCTSLTVLNLELQNKFNDDMKMITPFIEKLNFINREIRDIAHDLDSDYQEAYLIPVIEELVGVIRNSGANIQVNFFPKVGYEGLDNAIKDSLIKITKESLINAVKHGEADTIELDFVLSHEELCYIIEDNGVGFDLNKVKLGLGILNMKDRVKELGGKLNIDSTIGKGTTICVVVPL